MPSRLDSSEFLPLPFFPQENRPEPIDPEDAATALFLENGNIPAAAERLRVTAARLQRAINKSPRLLRLMTNSATPPRRAANVRRPRSRRRRSQRAELDHNLNPLPLDGFSQIPFTLKLEGPLAFTLSSLLGRNFAIESMNIFRNRMMKTTPTRPRSWS